MTFPREQQTGLQTQTPHLKLLWDLVPELTLSCHHGLERGWEAHLFQLSLSFQRVRTQSPSSL